MATELSVDFNDLIARRIKAAHQQIARIWLDRLQSLLSIHANDIFPSDQILDHIPALIHEIADYVGSPPSQPPVANTVIFSKARELGELRFAQKASVHQLLREYHILAGVLGAFVQDQFDTMPASSKPADIVAVANRLNDAVFILLQTTVDTFVGRYTDKIEEDKTRLEGFNRMVSHELRQPLANVRYATALLRSPSALEDDNRLRFLDVVDRNVKRLAQLLGMLGALVRPEHDNPQLQDVDVSKIVDDVLRQLEESAEQNGVVLRGDSPPCTLSVEVSRLELVLINLVSNGIKYRDPSKEAPFVEVSVAAGEDGCEVRVRDNGLGISSRDQPKIFRRFYRAHAARDGELANHGVGLGLAIAAECVTAMHGSIAFESTEGIGTTFVVTLPATPTERPPTP